MATTPYYHRLLTPYNPPTHLHRYSGLMECPCTDFFPKVEATATTLDEVRSYAVLFALRHTSPH